MNDGCARQGSVIVMGSCFAHRVAGSGRRARTRGIAKTYEI
jgi:hypothetical protein